MARKAKNPALARNLAQDNQDDNDLDYDDTFEAAEVIQVASHQGRSEGPLSSDDLSF
jgi:hypothetical protein